MVLKYQHPFPKVPCYDKDDPYGLEPWPSFRTAPHRGVDYNGAAVFHGAPIPVIADGIIDARDGSLGNRVVVRHPDGIYSGYAHMRDQSPLPEGTAVKRGDIIGNVGNTGGVPTHLHLTTAHTRDGAQGGGAYWSNHFDPISYIDARLNGDDSTPGGPSAPTEEELDEMAATKGASIVRDYQRENAGILTIALVYPGGQAVKLPGNIDVDAAIIGHLQVYGIAPTNANNTLLREKYASQLTTAQWDAFWRVYPGPKTGF